MNYYSLVYVTLFLHAVLGFRMIVSYYRKCRDAEVIPFGGSNMKFIAASIMGGAFSIVVMFLAMLAVVKDWIKEKL